MAARRPSPKHRRKAKPAQRKKPALAPAPQVANAFSEPVRLQKLLAGAGFGSRRNCEELIRQGRVTIDGEVAKLGDSADPSRELVRFDGEKLVSEKLAYWMINKPEGVITSVRDPEGRSTIVHLLPKDGPRLFPVGRLDLGTSGLVLLTNDGGLTQRLLHPSLGNEREYRVTVKGCVSDKTFSRLRAGVYLDDGRTGKANVDKIRIDPKTETTTFFLILKEGRKRQIRLSMLRLKHPVKKLVRVRMGPIRLGRLAAGAARPLRSEEIKSLLEHAAGLEPTRKPGPKRRTRPR
jgi:23S rRNA pseudouridine2605 synthase